MLRGSLPFFDFINFSITGVLLLFVVDFSFESINVQSQSASILMSAVWFAAAYVAGQILSDQSHFFLEKQFATRLLKAPAQNLLAPSSSRWRYLFPTYYRPLSADVRKSLKTKFKKEKRSNLDPDELFIHVHLHVSALSIETKLATFQANYVFCRNIAYLALVSCPLLWIGAPENSITGTLLCLGTFLAMLYRYLRFYRLFSVEAFRKYLAANPDGS